MFAKWLTWFCSTSDISLHPKPLTPLGQSTGSSPNGQCFSCPPLLAYTMPSACNILLSCWHPETLTQPSRLYSNIWCLSLPLLAKWKAPASWSMCTWITVFVPLCGPDTFCLFLPPHGHLGSREEIWLILYPHFLTRLITQEEFNKCLCGEGVHS